MCVKKITELRSQKGVLALLLLSIAAGRAASGATYAIDPGRSALTVKVFSSGLLSALGDDHVIRAPITSGSVEDSPAKVELAVDARRMTVLDPHLAPSKRAEVQEKMLGADVLNVARFAEIRFKSTAVKALAEGRWRVEGVLSLLGHSEPVSFDVALANGRFSGSATVSQRAFGIKPISIAAGTEKVKNEVTVEFEISTEPNAGR